MGRHQEQSWELKAEELVRHVRLLLDHRDSIEKALRKKLGRDQAASRLDQLESLVHALELELWNVATEADQTVGSSIVTSIRKALGVVGLTVAGLVTADVYQNVVAAETTADAVIRCVAPADPGQATKPTTSAASTSSMSPTSIPAEAVEPRPVGPPLSHDDILEMHELLDTKGWFNDLLAAHRRGR